MGYIDPDSGFYNVRLKIPHGSLILWRSGLHIEYPSMCAGSEGCRIREIPMTGMCAGNNCGLQRIIEPECYSPGTHQVSCLFYMLFGDKQQREKWKCGIIFSNGNLGSGKVLAGRTGYIQTAYNSRFWKQIPTIQKPWVYYISLIPWKRFDRSCNLNKLKVNFRTIQDLCPEEFSKNLPVEWEKECFSLFQYYPVSADLLWSWWYWRSPVIAA